MSIQSVREFIGRHMPVTTGLAALGAALEARATGKSLEAALEPHVRDLLAALGGGDMLDGVTPEEAAPTLAMLRAMLPIDSKLMYREKRALMWSYTEPEILGAIGDASTGHMQMMSRAIFPSLEGLNERLNGPGGAFLDVGTGVGMVAITAARMWPSLRIVGIDPWQPSLALARQNVRASGLEDRIELREQAAEQLPDLDAFDLIWVPTLFMQERAIGPTFERCLRALRPGGWVVVGMPPFSTTQGAVAASWRLRVTAWSGHALDESRIGALMASAGLADVQQVPTPPGAPITVVVSRRPKS